jgi:hypothetical protein
MKVEPLRALYSKGRLHPSLIFQTFRQSWNLGAMTLSITTLSKMTFSITINET